MTSMEFLGVVEGERDSIRKRHVWKLLEEQDRVLRSYYAQREGQGRQRKSGREREWKRSILITKMEIGFGFTSRRPCQECGSQESERDRQRAMFIMLDNFVGGMLSKETTWDKKSVREG